MDKMHKKTLKRIYSKSTFLFLALALLFFQSCKVQQSQRALPSVENHLKGELDYSKGGLELIQYHKNGDEIILGKIDKEGSVHFNLPEFDIKAINGNARNLGFQTQFEMLKCKDKGPLGLFGETLAKTPYDDIYYQMYAPIYVKKYGVFVAYLYPISDEKMLIKKNYNKIVGSNYYWFYIDRTINYNDECTKPATNNTDLEISVSADIQFKKGWNFVEKNILTVQNYGENNELTIAKTIQFAISSPNSKEVKWYLEQIMDDNKIQAAKKLYESKPIPKE